MLSSYLTSWLHKEIQYEKCAISFPYFASIELFPKRKSTECTGLQLFGMFYGEDRCEEIWDIWGFHQALSLGFLPKKEILKNLNLESLCVDFVESVSKAKLNRTCPQSLTLCRIWSLKQARVWIKDIINNCTNLNAAFIEFYWKFHIFFSFFFLFLWFCLQYGVSWLVIFRSERSPSMCFSTLLRLDTTKVHLCGFSFSFSLFSSDSTGAVLHFPVGVTCLSTSPPSKWANRRILLACTVAVSEFYFHLAVLNG